MAWGEKVYKDGWAMRKTEAEDFELAKTKRNQKVIPDTSLFEGQKLQTLDHRTLREVGETVIPWMNTDKVSRFQCLNETACQGRGIAWV